MKQSMTLRAQWSLPVPSNEPATASWGCLAVWYGWISSSYSSCGFIWLCVAVCGSGCVWLCVAKQVLGSCCGCPLDSALEDQVHLKGCWCASGFVAIPCVIHPTRPSPTSRWPLR